MDWKGCSARACYGAAATWLLLLSSEETALLWWRRAAEQGDTNAEGLLGFSYQTGDGVEQSFQNAVEWHTRAAEKGFLLSQLELAQIHYYGSYRPSRRVFGEDAPPSLERAAQY